ncbi:MAG TPA: HAD family hydrolase [Blastocatellia bacterium]|nr:HAD family hydrolase [Blastocatellia bacterium]
MIQPDAPSSPIALVISDIDGTLITSNHEIAESTRQTAAGLYERGIQLSLASSRPPRSIRPLAESLALNSPFAAFNGALLITADGEVKARSIIPATIIRRIKQVADEFGLGVWAYDELDWWAPWRDAFVDREEHTSGFSPKIDGYDQRILQDVNKLTVVGKPEFVAEAESRILKELGGQVSASRSKPRFLDVTSYGIHKGSVVVRLAEVFKVSTSQVAVIGDGPNDIDMFEQAGLSIAMGQAVDEVIHAATCITSSNDNDGWSRGIEKYVLGSYQSAGAQ